MTAVQADSGESCKVMLGHMQQLQPAAKQAINFLVAAGHNQVACCHNRRMSRKLIIRTFEGLPSFPVRFLMPRRGDVDAIQALRVALFLEPVKSSGVRVCVQGYSEKVLYLRFYWSMFAAVSQNMGRPAHSMRLVCFQAPKPTGILLCFVCKP